MKTLMMQDGFNVCYGQSLVQMMEEKYVAIMTHMAKMTSQARNDGGGDMGPGMTLTDGW
jgi:hypothetical protein